jgi:RNA polymerase sigma-19 factor, ECF subfamily
LTTLPPYDEDRLAFLLANGNEEAFTQVYNKYWNKVYSISLIYLKSVQLAEDAVQEVFLKIWTKREQLLNVRNLQAFIFIMARNHVIDVLKKRIVNQAFHSEANDWLPDSLLLPPEQIDLKFLQQRIIEAIEKLPPQQKNVIKLSREHGLSHEQIAARLGIDKKTVKNHVVRALATLRHLLAEGEALPVLFFLWNWL